MNHRAAGVVSVGILLYFHDARRQRRVILLNQRHDDICKRGIPVSGLFPAANGPGAVHVYAFVLLCALRVHGAAGVAVVFRDESNIRHVARTVRQLVLSAAHDLQHHVALVAQGEAEIVARVIGIPERAIVQRRQQFRVRRGDFLHVHGRTEHGVIRGVPGDRPQRGTPSLERIGCRVALRGGRCCPAIRGRAAVRHIRLSVQRAAAVVGAPGKVGRVLAHRSGVRRVQRPVRRDRFLCVGVRAAVRAGRPSREGVIILSRAAPGRRAVIGRVAAIQHRFRGDRARPVESLVRYHAGDMIRRNVEIRIPRVVACHLRPGQGVRVDGAGYLGRVGVVAVFVQAAHRVQGIQQRLDLFRVLRFPRKTNQPHAGIFRAGVQERLGVHRGAVFNAQGR